MADAVVHEWIEGRTGSERVFELIAGCMPTAELFALSTAPSHRLELGERKVATTLLDRPSLRDRRSITLPLMPLAWRMLAHKRSFEDVLVSHHASAMQFARHCHASRRLAYVHTPARYVWSPELDARGSSRALMPVRALLQRQDRIAVQSLDVIAVNSLEVARRVEKFWGRESWVIHPPVDTVTFSPSPDSEPPTRDYVLGISRFVPYKRLDLVLAAAESAGLPVVLAGGGPCEGALRAQAERMTVPVTFVLRPDDHELRTLYRNALCLVFPAHEDFGIVPVEAQACGTPVVALSSGGTAETVRDGLTGVLVDEPDPQALALAIVRTADLSSHECRAWAERFSEARFRDQFTRWKNEAR